MRLQWVEVGSARGCHGKGRRTGLGVACCLLKWNFQSRLAPYFSRFAFLKCHFFPFRASALRQLPLPLPEAASAVAAASAAAACAAAIPGVAVRNS